MSKLSTSIVIIILVIGGVWITMRNSNENHALEDEHHDDDVVDEYEIYPGDVAEKIENGENIILLDVRTMEEYAEIHLKEALLLPVQELAQSTLNEIGLGQDAKDKEIYIYCRSGSRSKTAYDIMSSLGYTNIKSIAGGMIHWEEDEYPFTETGEYIPTNQKKDNSQASEANISIDRTLHDFGEITQYGGTVETNFTVSNTGAKTLEIGQLTTSCSCTSATISSQAIEPGDSAVLTVIFDPDFHEEPLGVFKRTVFIPSNDIDTPEAEVSIQVDIIEGE